MTRYVRVWEAWEREQGVLRIRYEDLLADYRPQVRRLAAFLGLAVETAEVGAVIDSHQPGRDAGQEGFHFYKGQIGRFRTAYGEPELARLHQAFSAALQRMGYAE
jgi:hypothetical protein